MSKAGQFSDGGWDCRHSFDPAWHREAWVKLGRPTDPEAAINVVKRAWSDEVGDTAPDWWIAAYGEDVIHDSKGTVTPAEEYAAWRDAWQAVAVEYTRDNMCEWAERWAPCEVCGGVAQGNTCCP